MRTGCGLLQINGRPMPCRTFDHILKGGGCLADPPLFPPVKRIALVVPASDAWLGPSRGQLFAQFLRDSGHLVDIVPVGRDRQIVVDKLSGYDLVCSHAMQISTGIVAEAAERFPATKFVVINHSAIAHLERLGDAYVNVFAESLRLARELPNVWYASQEPVAEALRESTGIERCMWLPSPGVSLSPREFRGPSEPATVVIAGRVDSIKNNLVQAIACGMTRHKVRLVLCTRRTAAMAAVVEQLGVDHQWRGQLPHPQWIEFLRSEADVVLCCSLAESFNFVAAEAMQLGVPVVASDAIRFRDPALRAKHTDPMEIAAKIDAALDDYADRCDAAASLAAETVAEQEREYLSRIAGLLT